jgi:hypothetical protein
MDGQRAICTFVVFFSTVLFADQAPQPAGVPALKENSTSTVKTARGLNVVWTRVQYNKELRNPAIPAQYQNSVEPERLSIGFKVKMADARLLLGIDTDPTIEKITDSQGAVIDINQRPPQTERSYHNFILVPLLKTINKNQSRREKIPTEQSLMKLELDGALRERLGNKIGLLKGYHRALLAESLIYIYLPFKPYDKWERLTEDVEVRIAQAHNVQDVFYYNIEQRPENVISAKRITVGEPLPSRLVVGRQYIVRNNSVIGTGGSMGIGGEGHGLGSAEEIRFVIAVNPAHVIIPFELRDIPLTMPTEATPPRVRDPNLLKRSMRRKFVPSRIRTARRYEADKKRSRADQVPVAKEGKFFDVDWYSIGYDLCICSPEAVRLKNSLNLSIDCRARILDPEPILGTCDVPVIERITDGSGRDVNILLDDPRPDYMVYRTPRYGHGPYSNKPSPLTVLEGKARLAMNLPLEKRHFPTRGVMPVMMTIRLDHRHIGQSQKEIGCIEGYFHALTTESYKHIKVPFKASPRWVRLTSDLAIRVEKTWYDGFRHRYIIKEHTKAKIEPGRLNVYCPLPDGLVVERDFTGPDVPPRRDDSRRSGRRLPAIADGYGIVGRAVEGVQCEIDTVDYRIAVNPKHYKIPIKLEHIPLP